MDRSIIVIAHNLRSAHNVGSLLRTANGLGIEKVYLSGYTPYPAAANDPRLPHLASKIDKQIAKTALGAQTSIAWEHRDNIFDLIKFLQKKSYLLVALEQTKGSHPLQEFNPPDRLAILVGREVEGIEDDILEASDICLEIPMSGQKESFNVSVAAAIALYHCRYSNNT